MPLRSFLRATLPQTLIGVGVGIAFRMALDSQSPRDSAFYVQSGVHGALVGLGIGLVNLAFERTLGPRLRRAPLVADIVGWSMWMLAGIGAAFLAASALVYGRPAAGELLWSLPIVLSITFVIVLVIGFVSRIARLVGGNVLLKLMVGSYQRPRVERRVVLVLDLAGSTALAEVLGETATQALIARFFADIDEAFTPQGGEVLGYAGDNVIMTWPAASAQRNGRAAAGLLAAAALIEAHATAYRKAFGTLPEFRAGLHLGDVSVGEIGGRRRQISLFGDTMNVAARLQDTAKSVPGGWVASAAYVAQAALPPGLARDDLGPLALRGRSEPVPAFALVRPQAPVN